MIKLMKATSLLTTDKLSLNFRDSRLQQIGKFSSAKSVSTVGINESAQNLGFRRCGAAAKSENDRGAGRRAAKPFGRSINDTSRLVLQARAPYHLREVGGVSAT